ncbi:hypothetical protein NKH47_32955 [Mesorhizobium sp. M1060]|uniref:hypothetical protein n=1 Tax=unclassified Mesorhizobium TaxID=325217 RepID=UPI0004CE3177|nr:MULTISPECIES: hypothetical protein [unclassified Mesorhizobium]WJI51179.1 hypothetical protein NLY44_00080 [Mesorhizobium sp. C089B]
MRRHAVIEGIVDAAVELVQVHSVEAIFETLVLSLTPLNRLFLLPPLVCMARLQRVPYPFQHLLIEMELVQEPRKGLIQHLLANIFAATVGIAAPAFVGMSRAVVVDVFPLLDLRHDRTAAISAGHEAREGEFITIGMDRRRMPACQNALDPFPEVDRYQRLVLALVQPAIPLKQARIEPIAQNRMHGADRYRIAALWMDEAVAMRRLRERLE